MTGRRAREGRALRTLGALRLLIACLALGALPASAAAGVLRAAAVLDRSVVQRGEPVIVSVTVESDGFTGAVVEPPRPPGFAIERAGTSQNITMAAGSVVRMDVALFRVFTSVPGKYTIPPFAIRLGRQRTETRPVTFEVVASLPSGGGGSGGSADRADDRSGIFSRFVVDRRHVMWNEQIVGRIQIFSRAPLEDMPAWEAPEATGFWAEPLGEPRHDRVTIEGRTFERYERVIAFFPTRPGRLTLGPARARVRAVRHHEPSYDPLGGLFPSSPTEIVELPIEAAPIDIAVDPLPPGAPRGFQGAVGDLSLSVRVDRPRVRVGEPLIVSTSIRGDGNLASAADPTIVAVPDTPSYPAGGRTELNRSGDRLRGLRRREIAFIADQPGALIVLPISFAWFDPESGRYRVQSSDSIVVQVDPAKEGSAPTAQTALSSPAPPRPAATTGGDAAAPGIRPGGRLDGWPGALPLFTGLLSLAGYAGFGLAASSRRRAANDPRTRRYALLRETADAIAHAAHAPRAAGAAARAETALRDAAGLRFGIDPEGRSRRDLLDRLRGAGVGDDEIVLIQEALRRLEQAEFAPGGDAGVAAALKNALAIARRWSHECRT